MVDISMLTAYLIQAYMQLLTSSSPNINPVQECFWYVAIQLSKIL